MKKKKLSKEQILINKRKENREFNVATAKALGILIFILASIQIFYINECASIYFIRTYYLFNREVPTNIVCMAESKLKHHKTNSIKIQEQEFNLCSNKCLSIFKNKYGILETTEDAFSHEQISKSSAIIGLKERGEPELVYFKNQHNFNSYYSQTN